MNSFGEIYGHDKIKNHLQNAIELDKISHAYIFNGGLGSGKKSVAQLFAKTLQCEAGKLNHVMSAVHVNRPKLKISLISYGLRMRKAEV